MEINEKKHIQIFLMNQWKNTKALSILKEIGNLFDKSSPLSYNKQKYQLIIIGGSYFLE